MILSYRALEQMVKDDEFEARPPSDMYVKKLTCFPITDGDGMVVSTCSTEFLHGCRSRLAESCPGGLLALRCAGKTV